jgi:SAM-dependent methyltransferase
MAAFRHVYERYLIVEDNYADIAQRFLGLGCRRFADLGGGRGDLCARLNSARVRTVLVDLDQQMLAEGARPAIRADLAAVPLRTASVDGAAALNCLYFLDDPLVGTVEAHRLLQPGGTFIASAPSRWNDPELEGIDPRWGRPSPFDSEDAPALLRAVFADLEVDPWELVAYRLPNRDAIRDYLHAFDVPDWQHRADAIEPPLEITKRGAHVWARS